MNSLTYRTCVLSVLCAYALSFAQDAPATVVPPSLVFQLLALNHDLATKAKPKYLSPAAIIASPDSSVLYVAEQTAKQIAVVDLSSKAVTKTFLMPNEPTGLAIAPNGATLYATCSSELWPAGMVCVVDAATGKVQRRIAVGHSARSPVISPDGSTLYVCNQFNNDLSVVNVASGIETKRIAVTREPYAAAITPDGATIVVTNSLPDTKSTDTVSIACEVSLIDAKTNTVSATIPLNVCKDTLVGTHSMFGVCVSPDGKYGFVTHLIGRTTIAAITVTQGWVHTNNLAIIDIAKKTLANDVDLDAMTQGTANPWGLSCTQDGKFLCVLHAGSNDVTIIDLPKLLDKAVGKPNLSHSFTALQGISRRDTIPTKGPRSLAIVGSKAYIAGYFSDALDVVDISLSNINPPGSIALAPAKPITMERKGEIFFSDGSLCQQKWQSCHSCHPFTRPDALNWILQGAVANAPKNVISMLYSFWTPPTNWTGRRPDAFASVQFGIKNELVRNDTPELTVPIDTFLMRLKPVPSPFLVKGRLSAAAARGRALYLSTSGRIVDCKSCHTPPLYTDQAKHNAGVPDAFDPISISFDTPTLIEVWRTNPYNHLGSSLTLDSVIALPGHSTDFYKLTPAEKSDLVEYIKSL